MSSRHPVKKSFNEYAQQVFVPYMLSKLHPAMLLDLVWDRHITDSLKGEARAKRGKVGKKTSGE